MGPHRTGCALETGLIWSIIGVTASLCRFRAYYLLRTPGFQVQPKAAFE